MDKELSKRIAIAFTSPAWRMKFFSMSLTDYSAFQSNFIAQAEKAGSSDKLPEECRTLLEEAEQSVKMASSMRLSSPYSQEDALAVMRKLKPRPDVEQEEIDVNF
jgi:hypothetical protein